MRRCRAHGCNTITTTYNGERLCFVHRELERRMRFLRNMPGADELTAAERRRWIEGRWEPQTEP